MDGLAKALADIEKLIASKKTSYVGGMRGLQAHRTLAVQSHLRLVVKNQWLLVDAAE
jgi:hypothetical protein